MRTYLPTGMLLILAASGAWAQSGASGVPGVLSPSGAFRPVLARPLTSEAAAIKRTVTGTLTLQLTIAVFSSLPTSTPIQCELDASVSGVNASFEVVDNISETATAPATRSGSKAVCSMKLPYQWTLSAPTDTVSLSYTVTATGSSGAGRTSVISFDTIPAPKSGATTSFSLTGRI